MAFNYYEHSEWRAFSIKIQAIHQDINKLEWKQTRLLTTISDLEFAQDLVMRKKWDLEEVSKKTTKVLKAMTGDCDECWHSKYDRAQDEIKKLRINLCLDIATKQSKIDLLRQDIKDLTKEQEACRDRLIKEHDDTASQSA